jgi:hypothetical protein
VRAAIGEAGEVARVGGGAGRRFVWWLLRACLDEQCVF